MMPIDDVKRIFAVCAGYTSRQFGKADYVLWCGDLDGLNVDDCITAVRAHYTDPKTCTQYLVPGHVIGRTDAARRDRLRRERDRKVFGEIEARKEAFDPDAHKRGAAACRKAFEDAIKAKREREQDDPEPTDGEAA